MLHFHRFYISGARLLTWPPNPKDCSLGRPKVPLTRITGVAATAGWSELPRPSRRPGMVTPFTWAGGVAHQDARWPLSLSDCHGAGPAGVTPVNTVESSLGSSTDLTVTGTRAVTVRLALACCCSPPAGCASQSDR
jgi:hypothetical protein